MNESSSLIDPILDRIADLQSGRDRYFPEGLLPAYRSNRRWLGYCRPDTNLFFTAITVFTLRELRSRVPETLQRKIDSITEKAVRVYPEFRNKDGLKTYNFYRTPQPGKSSGHFPNGRILNRLDHFRLPDDVDDTAMIFLTTTPERDDLVQLKHKLSLHANLATRQIRNTYEDYRRLRAYSTWFGKNMYVEFDACVLSNILYCIYRYKLPLDRHDEDSLTFIRSVVETGRYGREPFRCSHSYPRQVLILYHIARLLATFQPEPLLPIRDRLIGDAYGLLRENLPIMDRLLVSTSLLRLGERPERLAVSAISADEIKNFTFFIAGMLTAYEHPLLYRIAPTPWVRMNWTCEGHSWALIAEYGSLLDHTLNSPL